MAEKSSFFNSVSSDRKYKAEDWAAYFATFVSSGVVLKTNATLAVSANGGSMSVTLGTGSAIINGYRYENTAALLIPLPTAHASLNRYDAIMIRWNRSLRAINAYVVSSTAAPSPTAEAPARTADIHELCVAIVYVAAGVTSISQSAITDKRLDSTVCGVATMIGDLDTKTLYSQVQADLATFKSGEEAAFATWSGAKQALVDAWITSEQADFDAWFTTIQDTLGNDAAGNLLNMINRYRARAATATLLASGWTLYGTVYTQALSVPIVPANCVLHGGAVEASRKVYAEADVHISAASAGSVTFTAASLPTVDLTVSLSVSEVSA